MTNKLMLPRFLLPIHMSVMVLLMGQGAMVYSQNSSAQPSQRDSAIVERVSTEDSANAELVQSIDRYEQTLADFNGVYDEATSEMYRGLANAYLELGNYAEANRAYGEALQSLRITTGLYSEPQLPLLDQYTISASFEQDWALVENNLNLSSHIASRLYEKNDARYLDITSQFASWKIKAYQRGIYRDSNDIALREAIQLYERLIDGLVPTDSNYTERLASYLYGKGLAHYYTALYTSTIPLGDFPASASEYMIIQECHTEVEIIDGRAVTVVVCEDREVLNPNYFVSKQMEKNTMVQSQLGSMRRSYRQALDAVEANPQATLEQVAEAMLKLGDMNFIIQDFRLANSQYSRVDELLSSEGVPEGLRDKLIGEPKKAMDGILAELPFEVELSPATPIGIVSFDVRRNGDIQNISISGSPLALEELNQALVMERLGRAFYRPKIVDGRPVESRLRTSASNL